jgi:hypothetical protein
LYTTPVTSKDRVRRHRERLRRSPWHSDKAVHEAIGAATSNLAAIGLLPDSVLAELRRQVVQSLTDARAKWTDEPLTDSERKALSDRLDEILRDGKGPLL